jgi:aminoglycoside phosphotransferase family enzyme/predicted kinase
MTTDSEERTWSALPRRLRMLLDPGSYPHPVNAIELIQTHISCVFLAGEYAYKLKKPVDFGFVDYSTLERRKTACEQEVRLNRRLCDGVYLGVSVVRDDAGHVLIDAGSGAIVDYAVKMRRVAAAQMLDHMVAAGTVTPSHARAVAARIAAFHRETAAADVAGDHAARIWRENIQQCRDAASALVPPGRLETIGAYGETFLARNAGLFAQRVRDGRVRDCHGDLRSDSVVVRDDGSICVMDCLEFSARLRHTDVAADIAFLVMDLAFRSRQDLADAFAGACLEAAPDETLPLVLAFFACYRALVRVKVESLLAASDTVPGADRAAATARSRRYLDLAATYARAPRPSSIIYMVGLSGSGKSYVACALAARIGAALVRSDAVRRDTHPAAAGGAYDAADYAPEQRQRVYDEMLARCAVYLREGRTVILDATHLARASREAVRALALDSGVPALGIEIAADEDAIRSRLAARTPGPGEPSDAGWATYVEQRARLEPPALDDVAPGAMIRVDSSASLSANLDAIERAIGAITRP